MFASLKSHLFSSEKKKGSDQAARPISISPLERITPLPCLTYQPPGLDGVFRDLAVRETISWEELGT